MTRRDARDPTARVLIARAPRLHTFTTFLLLTTMSTGNAHSDPMKGELSRTVRNERIAFPPIYVVVGVYRLLTDPNLYVPTWEKCKHGFVRGAVVGLGWVSAKCLNSFCTSAKGFMVSSRGVGCCHVQHPAQVR